jgi:nucleoside-diphosphate-sugar epimerase
VPGIEVVALDVRDADAVARAAEGASVVYHCVNPLYHQWPEMLLPMARGITEGTSRAGAKLVALDNLYMYGDTSHMTEATPVGPVSKKGALRVQAAEIMLEANARGGSGVAIGRAADFFGPESALTVFGERFFQRVLAGQSAQLFGNVDLPRSYSYTPDVAEGLVTLGLHREARGLYMLPVNPPETTRQLVARFARALGREIRIELVPNWLLRAVGLFIPEVSEMAEMTYQWRQAYRLDDAKIRAEFGLTATPWDAAVASTAAWGMAAYGKPAKGAARARVAA